MDAMLAATAEAEERHFWFLGLRRTARAMLAQALAGHSPTHIVDCGAGTGRNLEWLREFGPVCGVELSRTGLEVGRRFGRPMVQGSVAHLPIATASADVATLFDVLYCLPDEDERTTMDEVARILAPGGVVLLTVAALDILKGAHSTLTHEVRRYTAASLRRTVERSDLTVERLTFTNFVTFPLVLGSRLVDQLRGHTSTASTADLQVPAAPVNAVLNAALWCESQLVTRVNLPIGSSLMCVARKPRR